MKDTESRIHLVAVDHHRNGVGGMGFFTALFTDDEQPGRTFLGIAFPYWDEQAQEYREWNGQVAVLDVEQAAAGNIFMWGQKDEQGNEQPGDNAWRGADYYGQTMKDAAALWRRRIEKSLMGDDDTEGED
jgi:hypothetical protein